MGSTQKAPSLQGRKIQAVQETSGRNHNMQARGCKGRRFTRARCARSKAISELRAIGDGRRTTADRGKPRSVYRLSRGPAFSFPSRVLEFRVWMPSRKAKLTTCFAPYTYFEA